MDEAWAFEHSVECPVTTEFAWRFWTDVNNWRLDTDKRFAGEVLQVVPSGAGRYAVNGVENFLAERCLFDK